MWLDSLSNAKSREYLNPLVGDISIFGHSSKKNSYDSSDLIALNSTKGTVFLFDGSTLHKGNEKIEKYRIATFVRFGKRENYASVLDGGISDPLYYNC